MFITQWSQIYLETDRGVGNFSFQVQLKPDGEITFVYKNIPLSVERTSKQSYASFYGIADGYILNSSSTLYLYNYHNVQLPIDRNLEGSVYVLTPLQNCVSANDPMECNVTSCNSTFTCGWCHSLNLCSDGYDRQRQEWYDNNCDDDAVIYCQTPQASSSPVVVIVVVVLFVLFVPIISLLAALLIVWRVNQYRKGGSFWPTPRQVAGDNQVTPEKSDHIILRDADDAI